jgi:vacuolar protein sorting-associated protein 33A
VQCIAQKGGVLSNPAEREKNGNEDVDGKGKGKATSHGIGKVQAHPIVGWKGFEDVMATLPGETFDILQKTSKGTDSTAPTLASLRGCWHLQSCYMLIEYFQFDRMRNRPQLLSSS